MALPPDEAPESFEIANEEEDLLAIEETTPEETTTVEAPTVTPTSEISTTETSTETPNEEVPPAEEEVPPAEEEVPPAEEEVPPAEEEVPPPAIETPGEERTPATTSVESLPSDLATFLDSVKESQTRRTPSGIITPEAFSIANTEFQNSVAIQRQREARRRTRSEVINRTGENLQSAANQTQSVREAFNTPPAPAATTAAEAAAPVAADAATGPAAPSTGGPKTFRCPICQEVQGEPGVLVQAVGKAYSSITGWFQRTLGIRLPTTALLYYKERQPVSKEKILKKCNFCNNTREVQDPSDNTAAQQEAANYLQSQADNIVKNEAKLGTGGEIIVSGKNLTAIAGVGVPNDAPILREIPCADPQWGAFAGSQDLGNEESSFCVPAGKAVTYYEEVQAANPAGIGNFNICADHSAVITTGAGGTQFISPKINLDAQIIKAFAKSFSIGGNNASFKIEGETTLAGPLTVRPNAASDPNPAITAIGGVYATGVQCGNVAADNAFIVNAVMPKQKAYIDAGSGTNTYGGGAHWGKDSIVAAGRQALSYATMQGPAHPKFLQQLTSPRYWFGASDSIINLAYAGKSIESSPTGVCLALLLPGLVYNFPHIHAIPDDAHVHEHDVPNIELLDDAKAVRKRVTRTSAPLHVKQVSLFQAAEDIFKSIVSIITSAANQLNVFKV